MFLPTIWPTDVRELISLCWNGDYTMRPTFSVIGEALACMLVQQAAKQTSDSEPVVREATEKA